MTDSPVGDRIRGLEAQVARQDKAIRTLVAWLVQAQTGFGVQDMRGIEDILDGKR